MDSDEYLEWTCRLLAANERRRLHFHPRKWTAKEVDRLVHAFDHNTSITSIFLRSWRGFKVDHLVSNFERYGSVTAVSLQDYDYGPTRVVFEEWPERLLSAIGRLRSLEKLSFQASKLKRSQIRALFAGLQERKGLKTFCWGK